MNKKIIFSLVMVLFISTLALSQEFNNWKFSKVIYNGSVHGVGVIPDDCIWINLYGPPNSSNILILNPDGSEKARITHLTVNDVEYDLSLNENGSTGNGGRGMSVGPDGKVYHSARDVFYVVDYKTMEGLLRIVPFSVTGNYSITTAVADVYGNILVTSVTDPRSTGVTAL